MPVLEYRRLATFSVRFVPMFDDEWFASEVKVKVDVGALTSFRFCGCDAPCSGEVVTGWSL